MDADGLSTTGFLYCLRLGVEDVHSEGLGRGGHFILCLVAVAMVTLLR